MCAGLSVNYPTECDDRVRSGSDIESIAIVPLSLTPAVPFL